MRTRQPLGMAILFILIGGAAGAQFSAGNLVVSAIKSSSSAPPTSAAQVRILREYSPTGTATGQEFQMPTSPSGSNARLTNCRVLSTATEGAISLSGDGRYLLLSGYDAALGTANVWLTSCASVPRVVGRIEWRLAATAGAIDTSTRISDGFNQDTVRGVASQDGSAFYVAGGGVSTGGVHYVTLGSTGTSVTLQTTAWDMRSVVIRNGSLYAACGSTYAAGIGKLGDGLPTSDSQTFAPLAGFADNTNRPHDFYFADDTTLYVTDDRTNNAATPTGGLQKWSYDSVQNQWTKINVFRIVDAVNPSKSVGAYAVTGTRNSSNTPVLYVISTDNQLLKLTDTGNNAAFEVLAAAPQNEIWRGVALLPQSGSGGGSTATISGVITLQGCSSAAVPLTFRFRTAQGLIITQTVTPAANGAFTTQPFPRQPGVIGVRASNTLQEIRTVNLTGGNVQGIQIELPAGDASGDNYVDVADLLLLIAHYNRSTADADYLAEADFNRDGFNDIGDLLLLIGNYNRSGSFLP